MSGQAMAERGDFDAFLKALSLRESAGEYRAINSLGYIGAYQFGELALIDLGYYIPDGTADNDWIGVWTGKDGVFKTSDFLENPSVQDIAMKAWLQKLWDYAASPELSLAQYPGRTVSGIDISPAGILAGAHLVGIWGVASFLHSNGADDPADPYGVHVSEYARLFGQYTTPYDNTSGAGLSASTSAITAGRP